MFAWRATPIASDTLAASSLSQYNFGTSWPAFLQTPCMAASLVRTPCVHVSEQHNPAALQLAYPLNHARRPPHSIGYPSPILRGSSASQWQRRVDLGPPHSTKRISALALPANNGKRPHPFGCQPSTRTFLDFPLPAADPRWHCSPGQRRWRESVIS